ncbi:MAG: hypothetical protein ACXQTP_05635 [Candidatus Methanofastidiosia archaeon]
MQKKIIALSLIALVAMGTIAVQATEGESEKIEKMLKIADQAVSRLENYINTLEDPNEDAVQLLSEGKELLLQAHNAFDNSDYKLTKELCFDAMKKFRESASLLEIPQANPKEMLYLYLRREANALLVATNVTQRLSDAGADTEEVEALIEQTRETLEHAKNYINNNLVKARQELDSAKEMLKEIQEKLKEIAEEFNIGERIKEYLTKIPKLIRISENIISNAEEQEIDTTYANQLLDNFKLQIEKAKQAYEEGNTARTLYHLKNSKQAGQELVNELRNLKEQL